MNAHDFCKGFEWHADASGGRLLTPLLYDDGDQVVVFASPGADGWRLDDNGEGVFRLAASGVDPDGDRVRARLAAFEPLLGVRLDDDGESLYAIAADADIERSALAVAEASVQIMALSCLRQERQASDFRERVMAIVEEVAVAAGVEARRDVPIDESQTLLADIWLATPRPVLVIAASTPQRLMEAEIIWLDAARRNEQTYVLALVEDARAIGVKQYTRANYYTDKTVEFAGGKALADLITKSGQVAPH